MSPGLRRRADTSGRRWATWPRSNGHLHREKKNTLPQAKQCVGVAVANERPLSCPHPLPLAPARIAEKPTRPGCDSRCCGVIVKGNDPQGLQRASTAFLKRCCLCVRFAKARGDCLWPGIGRCWSRAGKCLQMMGGLVGGALVGVGDLCGGGGGGAAVLWCAVVCLVHGWGRWGPQTRQSAQGPGL